MKNIEVKVFNPEAIAEAEKLMVATARLTQTGHKIKNLQDFNAMYHDSYTQNTVKNLMGLKHNTLRQFNMIQVVVAGASRRFLSQITRRRAGVTFMSASLQYSDYSNDSQFVVPYEILEKGTVITESYLSNCKTSMTAYINAVESGIDQDAAGYLAPQGLANVILISATPQAWIEMIQQRTCKRNTKEMRYVMLKTWQQLHAFNSNMFASQITGPYCMRGKCEEGIFKCNEPIKNFLTPAEIIKEDFPLLTEDIT